MNEKTVINTPAVTVVRPPPPDDHDAWGISDISARPYSKFDRDCNAPTSLPTVQRRTRASLSDSEMPQQCARLAQYHDYRRLFFVTVFDPSASFPSQAWQVTVFRPARPQRSPGGSYSPSRQPQALVPPSEVGSPLWVPWLFPCFSRIMRGPSPASRRPPGSLAQ